MGRFHATLATPRGEADLAPLSFHEDGHFDWVLDFTDSPGLVPEVAPLGYYALAGADFSTLKRRLLEIAGILREGFAKPRHFQFDVLRCAHRRQGIEGCSACLSVCAAGAISSGKEAVEIEPHLCRGCGACALVCPSGAVRLESTRLGLEFWLADLADGVERVAVPTENPLAASRRVMESQLAVGNALLAGLGHPARLTLAEEGEPSSTFAAPSGEDKRGLLLAAIDALVQQAPESPVQFPCPGAPFGEVRIDPACTLCTACASICPAGALKWNGRQLAFVEERCLQCGLCQRACPEQALTLAARLLTSSEARRMPRVVAESDLFPCAECSAPYAPRALVERGRALMADHPMFQGENARLMALCPDCRQRAMATTPGQMRVP
jgi:ferredoxin